MTARADDATLRQLRAADPTGSTWVSANAGSGKTRVLTDRVVRLLLRGVLPERILCLTYTKAAAAEMQNRLFRRLGGWAMLPDDRLADSLRAIEVERAIDPEVLRESRRLFARAIEAPGGLKIQTIHAFASSLLRRFPLEAGVSPDFSELDDRARRLLLEEVADTIAEGPDARLLEGVAAHDTGGRWPDFLAEIASRRDRFATTTGVETWKERFGLPADYSAATLLTEVFLGDEAELLTALVVSLKSGTVTDAKNAEKLEPIVHGHWSLSSLRVLEDVMLTGVDAKSPFCAKTGSFPTKGTQARVANLMPRVEGLMRRIEAARPRRVALAAAERNAALHGFAGPFLSTFARRKQSQGVVDFDDLIGFARNLLRRPGVAEWVLYRLDGGIDHILVDEAQDTSPDQWDIVRMIAEEFSAGASARTDLTRTLFVVGDVKQSIYSFQGADPANFGRMAEHFRGRLETLGERLFETELTHSFRSAPAILTTVDHTFSRPELTPGLGSPPQHIAFFEDLPGRVDLWPALPKTEETEDGDWTDPVDRVTDTHHDRRLARIVAGEIRHMCDPASGTTLPLPGRDGRGVSRRPVAPGDFLVLVQRRSTLFSEIIRACKAEGLPIAGADVLRLGAEVAVKDLVALLSFLALPEDDLSLAAALRSPLFGWSEDRLFRLAHGRGKRFLWDVLRGSDAAAADTVSILDELRSAADFLRPYDLIERILVRHDGRRRLLARLGPKAEDGIDALLSQALSYEATEIPSLTGFLTYFEGDEVEVKRQLGEGAGLIRVMTIHGAKGLESPIVILPDTRASRGQDRAQLLLSDRGDVLWRTSRDEAPPEIATALADRSRKLEEERMRLLYVAMTRAESWLIVAGAGDMGRPEGGGWHALLAETLETRAGARPVGTPTGAGWRFDLGPEWDAPRLVPAPELRTARVELPLWSRAAAAEFRHQPDPRSPSDLGGAKVLPGDPLAEGKDSSLARGRRLHRLFELLPTIDPLERDAAAVRILAVGEDAVDPAEARGLAAEVAHVIDDPMLAAVFSPDALTEVDIAADVAGVGPLLGAIDRLVLMPGRILAVDYKTNVLVPATPEDVPEGLLRQMGAYEAMLKGVYPGRIIETAILWTAGPRLMPLPAPLIRAALTRVTAG